MDVQFLTVEEFNELLQQWHGEVIKISKHELDDLDETSMVLQDTSYARNTRRLDDYEPMHALNLNGEGTMKTDAASSQPLPSSVYEIPLEDNTLYEFDGQHFLVSTSRGVYKIEKA
ncbi:hypothetical protein SAMN05216238_103211 [Lentibacillus persicus]|uniref:Uncharacterized protein n=1 Tax=Lentibacillus persicus TaxID=640948 RepID=A0A1I1UGV0_9BACI|nr:hypothetical protein [Lentibacillus persicus]SFD70082.1 hypothetical protein SAMN05216238_103211 [Lentibacillus persicus]